MATTSTFDVNHLQTTTLRPFVHTLESLKYVLTHVFLPVQLPCIDDHTPDYDYLLGRAVWTAAHTYATYVRGSSEQAQWHRIIKMLGNLQNSIEVEHLNSDDIIYQLQGMQTGGTFPDSPYTYPC